jgi:low temperature requirement protein LtrA
MPIVLGVVIGAVGDALLLEQASAPASHTYILLQTGGAMLFLNGLGLFKRVANTLGNFPMSHGMAIGLLTALALASWNAPPATDRFTALCVAILALTCLWEWVSYHGGWVERMEAIGLPIPARLKARAELRRAARANKP